MQLDFALEVILCSELTYSVILLIPCTRPPALPTDPKDCPDHSLYCSMDYYQHQSAYSKEQLVLVELTGIIESDILEKCNNKCKILGINTEKPFLQVDKYVFAGEYEGDGEIPKPQLKYKCHTAKKLNMTRTFLSEKRDGNGDGGKVEWFHIKDDSDNNFPQMICSFAQGSEAESSLSEGEDGQKRQLNVSTENSGNLESSFELEKRNVETEEPCPQDELETGQPLEDTVTAEQTSESL
uniref:Transcription factor TFIIIC triple barrel domain-containing protein n=1 Tax=Leptobrachium leishanense TaxID=445787 RepID=A0A8C5QG42_9ANUR